jgi:putative lipoic acid-binding regulatory protein
MMTSGTAANGFGPKITFRMGGNGYDGYTAGSIGTIRNGADNTHNLNFATSNGGSMTTKMTITNTGNVGIGTNSPAHKLHVVGTNNDPIIRAVRGNNTSQYLDIRGYQVLSQGNHLLLTADDTKEIWLGQESNTQRMVINSSGKVGIGTTSPADFLHIGSVGGGSIRIETYETNAYAQIASADGNLSLRSDPSNSYSLSIIDFTIDNNEKMRITSAGNVGIGTTSPAYLLDVNEDDNVLAFRVTGGGGGAPIASFVRDVGATGSSVNINAQSNFPQIQFANTGNTFSIGGDTSGNFKISDNTAIGTNDRITINNTGNVGIGTTSPSNKLDVNGIIEADKLILPTAGTAGAGTVTTPAGKLDVRSDSTWSNSAIVARGTTNQNPVLAFYRPSGGAATSYPWWLEANGSTFQIKTGSAANIGSESVSTKVTINNSGDVGIGTTSPAAKLEVNGTSLLRGLVNITTSGEMLRLNDTNSSGNPYMSFYQSGARRSFIQHNDSGDYLKLASEYGGISFFTGTGGTSTQKMTILSGGDVGIGTTSPGSRLSVIDASTGRTWSDYFATVATFERNSDSNINIVSSNTGNGAIWFGDTSSMVRGRIRYAHNGDEMSFWVSAAPRATLDSSGNLAITGTLSQNSDIVLKENVEDIDGALEKVKQLRGVEFNMIGDDKKQLGVIAQEVEKVLPELVTEKDNIRSVAYGNIAAVLIEAIKEQQNQIENLESRIQTLENQ